MGHNVPFVKRTTSTETFTGQIVLIFLYHENHGINMGHIRDIMSYLGHIKDILRTFLPKNRVKS